MTTDPQIRVQSDPGQSQWPLIGIAAGLLACFSYPVAVYVPLPSPRLTFIVGAAFEPSLAIAC